jgi:type IV pilus assembly protein PilA
MLAIIVRQPKKQPVGRLVPALVVVLAMLVFVHRVGERREFTGEHSVIQNIRTIHVAQTQYYSQYGHYAQSLEQLGPRITDDLASGTKGAYRFRVEGGAASYEIHAEPLASGRRSFYSDQTMVIRSSRGRNPATSRSEPLR